MFTQSLHHITAQAVIPEQLEHYVTAVSGRKAIQIHGFVAYVAQGDAVLVAYPTDADALAALNALTSPPQSVPDAATGAATGGATGGAAGAAPNDTPDVSPRMTPLLTPGAPPQPLPDALGPYCEALRQAVRELAAAYGKLTVLTPLAKTLWAARENDAALPEMAAGQSDSYWSLPVPAVVPQKTRNMITRASREVSVHAEAWGLDHEALVARYLQRQSLASGARAVFANLSRYAPHHAPEQKDDGTWLLTPAASSSGGSAHTGAVLLLGARTQNGSLAGCCIGDFSTFTTAFYMFAFRAPTAPPGTADFLLHELMRQANAMGHSRMNLGLGIDGGISFFKQKWRAAPFLAYTESLFDKHAESPGDSGFFGALRNLFRA